MRVRLIAALLVLSALPALAAIRGTVMSTDGKPLAGAKVSAYALEKPDDRRARLLSATPEAKPIVSASTDSKGTFVLDGIKDAVVRVQADANGYAPEALRVEREDDLVILGLRAAETKSGSVTASGKPVAGATVIWQGGNGAELIMKSDAAGKYSLPDPAKWGNAGIVVTHPDFAPYQQSFGAFRKTDLTVKLEPGVAIAGTVTKGATPVAKASILVDGWPLGTSGDDGSFKVAHARKDWDVVEAVTADSIATQAHASGALKLKLAPPATVSGVVRDSATQLPVAGIEIGFQQPAIPGRVAIAAITDAKGAFNLLVRPGSYRLGGLHPSYSVDGVNLSAASGQRVSKSISAIPKTRISGTVVDEQRRGIAAAAISVDPVGGLGMPGVRRMMGMDRGSAFSAPDGRFTAYTTEHGDLQLTAIKKGLPEAKSSTLRLAQGEKKAGVTITVPLGVAFSGRVIDRDGKPVSGVAVTTMEAESGGGRPGGPMLRRMILGMSNSDPDAVTTGSDGAFSVRLKEGMYDVKLVREGFAAKVLRGQQVTAATKPVEVTLEPGVEITGRVVRSGNGIEGVNINLLDADNRAFAATSSDGRFILPDLTPGTYMVSINKPDEFIQMMRSMTAPTRDIVIDIPAGGRISGRVVDKSSGRPVTSFRAGIDPSRAGGGIVMQMMPNLRTFTADDGTFVMENVPPGTAQVVVSAPGFTTARVPGVTVEEGKTATVEVSLETGAKLVGRVTGPDGRPLSGVSVRPLSGGPIPVMNPESVATTDNNGDYSIDQLEPGGDKTFVFAREGYVQERRTVSLSGKETRVDVQLTSGLTVRGQVVTEGGMPVADAEVTAMSAVVGSSGKMARTDAGGGFVMEAMAPGRYSFQASKEGLAFETLRDFDISSGASPRIVLKSGATLTGHVSGLSESDLASVVVRAAGSNGAGEAVVDSSGNFRIEGAPTGTVRVTAMMGRMLGSTRQTETKTVELSPGGSAQVELAFTSDVVVRGRITRNGAPAANSAVQFNPRGGGLQRASATTDESGNYSVTGLSDGDYNVTVVDMQRLNPYSSTYSVHGSGNFDIDIRTATLRGRVVDRGDTTPIGGARVQLRRSGSEISFPILQGATTDDSGSFVVEGVGAGSYTISAEKEGYGNVIRDISVSESSAPDITLDLARNDGVLLKVVDGRDGRTLSASVTVFDAQNRQVYESNRFGMSETSRIPLGSGEYRAVVSAMGYAPKNVRIMSPSQQTIALTPGGSLIIRSKSNEPRRAMLIDASGTPYQRPFSSDPAIPLLIGDTRLQNVAPGAYKLQLLGPGGTIVESKSVVIAEGQEAVIDL